jgi:hypothetical protein
LGGVGAGERFRRERNPAVVDDGEKWNMGGVKGERG